VAHLLAHKCAVRSAWSSAWTPASQISWCMWRKTLESVATCWYHFYSRHAKKSMPNSEVIVYHYLENDTAPKKRVNSSRPNAYSQYFRASQETLVLHYVLGFELYHLPLVISNSLYQTPLWRLDKICRESVNMPTPPSAGSNWMYLEDLCMQDSALQ
jgi:hypothetical protein